MEAHGLEVEGVYRKNGEKAKIRKLILAFNQGQLERERERWCVRACVRVCVRRACMPACVRMCVLIL